MDVFGVSYEVVVVYEITSRRTYQIHPICTVCREGVASECVEIGIEVQIHPHIQVRTDVVARYYVG